jgi:hypothetical protein
MAEGMRGVSLLLSFVRSFVRSSVRAEKCLQ